MMRYRRLLLIIVSCAALEARAQENISGGWHGSFDISGPSGMVQHDTAFLMLQQTGTQVTGTAGQSVDKQTVLEDGMFREGMLTFAMNVRGTKIRFTLAFADGHLRGAVTGMSPDPTQKVVVDVTRLPEPTVGSLLGSFSGSVLVSRAGHVLVDKSFGSANLEWGVPNTSATRFHIGSLTKQFTAASVLLLAEQGKLRLDDPVSKYVDKSPDAWKNISLFHLLSHQSGIVSITDLPPDQAALTKGGSPAEIVDRFRNQPLVFAPGTQARYSNSGYILLGMVIEKVTGMSYAAFLQKNILERLGMRDTGVDDGTAVVANLASGYRRQNGVLLPADFVNMRIPLAAGDMYSTTGDLARWNDALYGGKLLLPDSLKKMITPGLGDFGLGVVVKQERGELVISHTGGIQGFVADLRYYPTSRTSVVVLSNTESEDTLALSEQIATQARSGNVSLGAPAPALRDEILAADRELFDAYNTCDTAQFARKLSPDLEFFHDTTGLTNFEWNVHSLEKRCTENTRYHRSIDEASVQVFPVPGYGAIEIGTHRFTEKRADGTEQLDATPGFANIWRQTPEGWKLTRVISFGHR